MPEAIEIQITGSSEGLTEALGDAQSQIEGFAGPIGDLVGALGLLSDAFDAIDAVTKFVEIIGELGSALEHAAQSLGMSDKVTALNGAFDAVGGTLLQAFKPAIDIAITGLTNLLESFNEALKGPSVFHDVLTALAFVVNSLAADTVIAADIIGGVWDVLKGVVTVAIDGITSSVKVLWDALHFDWGAVAADAAAGAAAIKTDIVAALNGVIASAKEANGAVEKVFSNLDANGVNVSGGLPGNKEKPGGAAPQATGAGGAASIAPTEELQRQLAFYKVTYDQMQAYELQFWKNTAADAKAGSDEQIQALEKVYGIETEEARQAAQKTTEAAKQAAAQKQAIDKEDADHAVQMAKLNLDAEKDSLDQQVAAGKITAAQKFTTLEDFTNQEYQLELGALDKELEALDTSAANYQSTYKQLYDKIETLTAEHKAAMEKLATELADAQKKAASESGTSFKAAFVDPSLRAFDQMLSGILQGTQTWQQTLTRAASNLLITEIESDAKWLANRLLVNTGVLASDTKTAQGGALAWLFSENQKTAASTAGNTARAASDASSQSNFLGQLATKLAQWLGIESDQTAATVAGNTARTTADVAGAAAGRAVAVAQGFAQITIDAAVAAAGTMAAISAIPYIGPFMAPEMASAAYMVTMGWGAGMGGGAFAAGAWSLPSDMLAMVHQGEMIVPADVAAQIRSGSSGGATAFPGGGSASGANGSVQITFNNNVSAIDGPSVVAHANRYAQTYAAAIGKVLARNPSLRGAY